MAYFSSLGRGAAVWAWARLVVGAGGAIEIGWGPTRDG
jgi:hypothetical protein